MCVYCHEQGGRDAVSDGPPKQKQKTETQRLATMTPMRDKPDKRRRENKSSDCDCDAHPPSPAHETFLTEANSIMSVFRVCMSLLFQLYSLVIGQSYFV